MTAMEFLAKLEDGMVQTVWADVGAADVPEYVAKEWGELVLLVKAIDNVGGRVYDKLRDLAVQEEMLA
jgi:hypothetical protein